MCGIVGYIGLEDSKEILLKGLEKLEYRGYDSAGIALKNEQGVFVFKEKGRIADLCKVIDTNIMGNIGIGHTRWATHGTPSKVNAHPHQSTSCRFTIVHNGIIENYSILKRDYLQEVKLYSDTDTEIIVHLIEKFINDGHDTEKAFSKTLELLEGSYAIALIDDQNDDAIFVAKNKSPLLVGLGKDFNVIASDSMAMIQLTDQYVELMDKEMVIVTRKKVTIKALSGEIISRAAYTAELNPIDLEKGAYPHYMLKEINEQPLVMRKIIQAYQNTVGELTIDEDLVRTVNEADRIYIVACGTSYHAGLIGKNFFEKLLKIPTEAHLASEFVYNMPLLSKKPLFIFISQSGETADCRAVLVKIKGMGYKALTLTNVQGSTLSREANHTLLLYAGPEIAVASTKAYTAEVAVLAIIAEVVGKAKGLKINFNLIKELGIVATAMEALTDDKIAFEKIVREFLNTRPNAFFIGRSIDYYIVQEAALKLKEVSYIQAEGFAGGELKHGTIALIEEGTPVFALITQSNINLTIRSNVKEVAARGANTCVISMRGLEQKDDNYVIPHVHKLLTPLVMAIPAQLIAYYAALHRNCDVDKPRNLAKSVTVE